MALQTPLLHVPTKETDEVDFSAPFRLYIQTAYQDDPDRHAAAISALSRCRQDMRGAGKDLVGRDILYRYYGQLELLDLRFPISENAIKIQFKWYDAFTNKLVSQYSIAYEKASVIFNIAATCSSIGSLQNRFEVSGLKLAFNYFQAAAGLFQYINDNFLHPPSVDMSRDSIKVLVDLMLGQAQECFIEKVLMEKKSGALVAKLAAQTAFVYSNVVDGFGASSLRGQFERTWVDLIKIKSKHFQALAHYHKSMQMETEGKYGELVAHATAADEASKEAVKLANQFASIYSFFSVGRESKDDADTRNESVAASLASAVGILSGVNNSLGGNGSSTSGDATALVEMTKALAKLAADRRQTAVRDNDMIYHAVVPSQEALAPIEKLNAVKTIPFADLCANGQADITQIIGPDIFQALVPLSVHESSSLYSEEKAKLLRAEQERVKTADAELQATFDSLNMISTLDRLKRFLKLTGNAGTPSSATASGVDTSLPEQIMNISVTVLSEEQDRTKIEILMKTIEATRPQIKSVLDEVTLMLDKEQQECESLRVKYMDQWTMEPSFKLASGMRQSLREHRDALNKASETDQTVMQRLQNLKSSFISLFTKPIHDVETHYASEIASAGDGVEKKGERRVSLIDEDIGSGSGGSGADGLGVLGEQIAMEKIDGILNRLRSLKKERADIVESLKAKLHGDDISSLLLLNKGREKQIFKTELSKFAPIQSKITINLESHSVLLQDVVSEFNKLVSGSQAMRVLDARERRRGDLVREWTQEFEMYREIKAGLSKGSVFYADLLRAVDALRISVADFVDRRNAERADLVKRIDDVHAERSQQALHEQLHRLSLTSPMQSSAPAASTASPTAASGSTAAASPHAVSNGYANANVPQQLPQGPSNAQVQQPIYSGYAYQQQPAVPQSAGYQPALSQPQMPYGYAQPQSYASYMPSMGGYRPPSSSVMSSPGAAGAVLPPPVEPPRLPPPVNPLPPPRPASVSAASPTAGSAYPPYRPPAMPGTYASAVPAPQQSAYGATQPHQLPPPHQAVQYPSGPAAGTYPSYVGQPYPSAYQQPTPYMPPTMQQQQQPMLHGQQSQGYPYQPGVPHQHQPASQGSYVGYGSAAQMYPQQQTYPSQQQPYPSQPASQQPQKSLLD